MEGYANPTVLNGTAGNSAPVGGKRKLKLVTRKVARKALKKLGLKMRGGEDKQAVAMPEATLQAGGQAAAAKDAPTLPPAAPAAMGGKRKTKKGKRSASKRRASIFGL